jgi:IS30 family transposase
MYGPTAASTRGLNRSLRLPTWRSAQLAPFRTYLALRAIVQDDLRRRYSPEQIAGRLRRRFPENPEMWVSTETIYQSL